MNGAGKKRRFEKGDFVFTLFLLVFGSILLLTTFGYRPRSRIFPLIVLVPAVILLVVQTLSHFIQLLHEILESLSTLSFGEIQPGVSSSTGSQTQRKNEIVALSSWIAYGIATYLIGFEIASPIFIFCVSRFYAKRSIAFSALLGLGVFSFLKGMFEYMLGIDLYDGELLYYL